jgi:hypothetical protein
VIGNVYLVTIFVHDLGGPNATKDTINKTHSVNHCAGETGTAMDRVRPSILRLRVHANQRSGRQDLECGGNPDLSGDTAFDRANHPKAPSPSRQVGTLPVHSKFLCHLRDPPKKSWTLTIENRRIAAMIPASGFLCRRAQPRVCWATNKR